MRPKPAKSPAAQITELYEEIAGLKSELRTAYTAMAEVERIANSYGMYRATTALLKMCSGKPTKGVTWNVKRK